MSKRALFVIALFAVGLCSAQGFDAELLPAGSDVVLEYDAATDSYYRVFSADSLTGGSWAARTFRIGTADTQSWTDAGAMALSSGAFYRIERVSLTNAFDHDGDGLNDAWELRHGRADPLRGDTDDDELSDGAEVLVHGSGLDDPDTDSDGIGDGVEANLLGTRPESPYSGVTLLYDFPSDAQGWSSDTGTYGVAGVSWNSTTGMPSAGALSISPAAGSGYGDYYVRDGSVREDWRVLARPVWRAWFYLPAEAPSGAVRVQPWIKSDADGWQAHYSSGFTPLSPGVWTPVMWDMTDAGTQALAEVDEWAVKVVWDNRTTWNGAVLMDSLHLAPLVSASNLAPQITSVTPVAATAGRFQKFELDVGLTNIAGLNPYDPEDVDLAAVFTSPSGVAWRVWGFYMEEEGDAFGQGGWKVRFAPNETGSWTYSVQVSNRWGANVSATSSFTCVASGARGWIRVSPDDSHYLEHADGTAFYGIGYCRPYDADDEGIFWDARDHGVNLIHWWMAPWDTLLTAESVSKGHESSPFYTYEQGSAAEIDRIVGYAETYGVKLVFTVWTHDALRDFNHHTWRKNGSWAPAFDQKVDEPEVFINAFSRLSDPPKSQDFFHDPKYLKYQDNLYRYLIARWGYSEGIGLWNLASELYGTVANSLKCVRWQDPLYATNKSALVGQDPYVNMDTNQVDGSDYTIPWITHINSFFKTNDPFGHPTTACNETDEYWDDGFEIVDIAQIHAYSESYSWVTPPIMLAKYHHYLAGAFDKPAFMGETGSWKWRTYQPDFLRACIWPALCSGAAATPMMWTVPAFGQYCDPVMGPWLDDMADEAFLFSRFIHDIDFPRLHLQPAAVTAVDTRGEEPAPTLIDSFEQGISSNWTIFGTGVVSIAPSGVFHSHGTNSLRMNVDMKPWPEMTNAEGGVECYSLASYDWSDYWPDGVLRVDLYIPEFYHPTNNPDGFLKGVNRDPRSVVEIAVLDDDGVTWNWYSTRAEYAAEHQGWKKLTVGMMYNLELQLDVIPTLYEAEHIRGIKIWFGDAGILRGPVYIDNLSVGCYNYNTWGMVSSNGQFAFAWIQDRQWTNTLNRYASFSMNGLQNGAFNVEFWNSRRDDINSARNLNVTTGTLYISSTDLPDFARDMSMKIRRIGAVGATVHDVSIGSVSQSDWIVRSSGAKVNVTVVNQGTANETCNLYLFDATTTQQVSTVSGVSVNAGQAKSAAFTWNCSSAPLGWHSMIVSSAYVSSEADYSDNRMTAAMRLVATNPPWDACDRMRRWAPRIDITDARSLTVSTNRATEGGTSFLLSYAGPTNAGTSAEMWFDNVFESWAGKSALTVDIYRENGASNLQCQIWTGTNWTWYYSWTQALQPGWNSNVSFALNSNEWGTNGTWWVTPANLDKVQQILFKFTDYTNAGHTYIDNIRLN